MSARLFVRVVLLAATLLVTACATQQPFQPVNLPGQAIDTPFSVSGRLAVKVDDKGSYGNFDWQHAPTRDVVSITTPVGSTVARLTRDADGVLLEADGKETRSANVEELTNETLGWTLPLDNLVWWIRGVPAPNAPSERLADGALQQQGWTIRFFRDEGDTVSRVPKRVELVRDRLSIKLVTHAWQQP
ncbi:lipoprotein insertase outer membrane protein LolB [Crenobacter sp. SG2305]|uniref:lipoprotein insertase outer membrane protein LolB n=1 Tax=Crenobacter oryzisoli TaxID=3056844 RepID=UPI0025AB0DD9|nr:lipoprotein insertase outer membrane protein LolB [Crenobacter sp. SG2305]MDN0082123.1 lipoprotein insertase outer membrane protein LolB [Crenobacter sp. SG2305]